MLDRIRNNATATAATVAAAVSALVASTVDDLTTWGAALIVGVATAVSAKLADKAK